MVLDAKPTAECLDAPDVGNLLAVDPGLGAVAHHSDVDLVPVVVVEQSAGGCLEFCRLFRAFRVEPAAKTDSVHATVFPGCGALNLTLIAFRFPLLTDQTEAETGVEVIALALGLRR